MPFQGDLRFEARRIPTNRSTKRLSQSETFDYSPESPTDTLYEEPEEYSDAISVFSTASLRKRSTIEEEPLPELPYQGEALVCQTSKKLPMPLGCTGTKSNSFEHVTHHVAEFPKILDHTGSLVFGIAGGLVSGIAQPFYHLGEWVHPSHDEHPTATESNHAFDQWLRDSCNRTEAYLSGGSPAGDIAWISNEALAHDPHIRGKAISGGEEGGKPWYIARAFYNGSLQPGKCRLEPTTGASIGYGNESHDVSQYEFLVGDMSKLRWVHTSGKMNADTLKATPVEGGREYDGTVLYISRVHYWGSVYPGKASKLLKGGYFTYRTKEKSAGAYEVLCHM